MKPTRPFLAFAVLAGLATFAVAFSQHGKEMKEHVVQNLDDVKWGDAPPFLPPGAKFAVAYGDPSGTGPFAIRAKMPANYKIAAHSHPGDEHVVVFSGSLHMGMGDKLDAKSAKALKAGGFAMMPAGQNHFAFTGDEETVLLVYGMGPVEFKYVNPADDPRNKK